MDLSNLSNKVHFSSPPSSYKSKEIIPLSRLFSLSSDSIIFRSSIDNAEGSARKIVINY